MKLFIILIMIMSAFDEAHHAAPDSERQMRFCIEQDTTEKVITRGDSAQKKIALVFTGDEFADGGDFIQSALENEKVKASFFLTGNFYRNKKFKPLIRQLIFSGHYLGSHSNKHLLYCDWVKRDSLLVTEKAFKSDLAQLYKELPRDKRDFFYRLMNNDTIVKWTRQQGLQLVCFTPGTRSNADYTYPEMGDKYVDSKTIFNSILNYEQQSSAGLNGFILLIHIGVDPRRTDKFYHHLPGLIAELKSRGYQWVKIDDPAFTIPAIENSFEIK